jgi:hypothetical protein
MVCGEKSENSTGYDCFGTKLQNYIMFLKPMNSGEKAFEQISRPILI